MRTEEENTELKEKIYEKENTENNYIKKIHKRKKIQKRVTAHDKQKRFETNQSINKIEGKKTK
jgi:hypothetical protein